MEYQMSIFDFLSEPESQFKLGDWIEKETGMIGRELSFDEICDMTGQQIAMDMSTQNHEWYKVVQVEQIVQHEGTRRLIYYDGSKQRGLVSEIYFREDYPYTRSRSYQLIQK